MENRIEKAKNLCIAVHSDNQYILDNKEVPYYMHCFTVAEIISKYVKEDINQELCLTMAYLHDTVEDTSITTDYIKEEFGEDVARGVSALTVNKSLTYDKKIPDSVERIKKTGMREAAIVKMADRCCNILSVYKKWTRDKQEHYAQDAKYILAELGGASLSLSKFMSERIKVYEKEIKEIYKTMDYIKTNKSLYAYDKETGITAEFEKGKWGLADRTYAVLSTDENAARISEDAAKEITDGKTANKFIEDYYSYLSNGG